MDTKLARLKELITQKEAVDAELESLLGGSVVKEPKTRVCKKCGAQGHNAKTCTAQLPLPSGA